MKLFNKIKNKIINTIYSNGKRKAKINVNDNINYDPISKENITSSDFIDYDGMGNQGRFPTKEGK